MSFLSKALATFGLGSAQVNAHLSKDVLVPGESVTLHIDVKGGKTAQQIDNINLAVCCQYLEEVRIREAGEQGQKFRIQKQTYPLVSWSLPYAFEIGSEETRTFETELTLPWNTPVTLGDAKVWLETELDISMAVDPSDKDSITVRPDPLMDGVFSALENAGLRILKAECEAAKGFPLPFTQEFEFVPTEGPFHGVWRELEIVAYRDDETLKLWFEFDRRQRGLTGLLSSFIGSSELNRQLTIPVSVTPEEAGQQVMTLLEQIS